MIARLRVLLTPLLAITAAATPGLGQGMLQLSLKGELVKEGGARIEMLIGARLGPEGEEESLEPRDREVEIAMHLARGTTAGEILQLVDQRLDDAGYETLRTEPRRVDDQSHGHLFIEDVLFIELRLALGLEATLTTCEGPIRTLRFLASQAHHAPGRLLIAASGKHDHNQRLSRRNFVFEMGEGDHPSLLSERIFQVATEAGWIAERSGPTEWSPMRWNDGSRVMGMSIRLESEGDWALRLELPREP